MCEQQRSSPYHAIERHVDLLYDHIHHYPDAPFEEIPDPWVSMQKLAGGGVRVIVSAFY
jgi:hypothetical protein